MIIYIQNESVELEEIEDISTSMTLSDYSLEITFKDGTVKEFNFSDDRLERDHNYNMLINERSELVEPIEDYDEANLFNH